MNFLQSPVGMLALTARRSIGHPNPAFTLFTERDTEQSIGRRFEQQAQRHGNRLALRTRTRSVTYQELNRQANRIAWVLLQRLGSSNEPVALFLEKGVAFFAAILGALKAGKIYVPLC